MGFIFIQAISAKRIKHNPWCGNTAFPLDGGETQKNSPPFSATVEEGAGIASQPNCKRKLLSNGPMSYFVESRESYSALGPPRAEQALGD
jgi:hypothetical protein